MKNDLRSDVEYFSIELEQQRAILDLLAEDMEANQPGSAEESGLFAARAAETYLPVIFTVIKGLAGIEKGLLVAIE